MFWIEVPAGLAGKQELAPNMSDRRKKHPFMTRTWLMLRLQSLMRRLIRIPSNCHNLQVDERIAAFLPERKSTFRRSSPARSSGGAIEIPRLDAPSVQSINQPVKRIAL